LNVLAKDIWKQVTEGFTHLHGKGLKDLWLKHTRPLSFSKGLFILGVPNLFVQEWLEKKYVKDIEKIFKEVTGSPVKIMIKIDGYLYRLIKEMQGDLDSDKKDIHGKRKPENNDNEISTDISYVVRPENRLVYSAFERILREPPGMFNPLYFFGPGGVGKSLLVRNFLDKAKNLKRFPTWYKVGAVEFAQEFQRAARIGNRVQFRGAILRCDLFILEDLQEVEGKLKLQLELLSILKYLTERSRQVIITSSMHPRDIKLIENPLASFLLSGMVVSVAGYSLNSTVEILSVLCKEMGFNAPPTLIETVARTSTGGLRGLFGIIKKVVKLASLKDAAPTPQFLKEHFPEFSKVNLGVDSVDRIINLVSDRMGVKQEQIASNSKIRKAVLARHMVIYLASTLMKTPARRICRWLGNISPSIVPYARRKVEEKRKNEDDFNTLIKELQSEVEGGQKYLF